MAANKPTRPTLAQTNPDTAANYQATEVESSRTRLVNERYELAHKHQYPFWIDFDRYYKMYESYVNDSKVIWQTKIFIPVVFSVIERFLPRIISNKPTVNFLPRLNSADLMDEIGNPIQDEDAQIQKAMGRAQKVQANFDWQWDQVGRLKDGGMYMEQLRFVKDALICGTAIAKIPWRKESRDTKVYNESNEVENRIVKYFDGPDFMLCDLYDIFYDPEAIDIQQASWIIHRTRKTYDELYEINQAKGVEIYKNLNILKGMTPDSLSATENDFKYRRKVALGGGQVLVQDDTTDKFEVMECWGLFPKLDPKTGEETADGLLEPRVITLANRSVVIRDVPYPYWHGKKPFVKYTPFPRTFEFYGIPLIKHLERMQFYINEFVGQKFDNNVISLNQMLVVDPQANLEDWQLVWRPGGVLRAHPEYVKPLEVGDVTGGITQSLEYLSEIVQLTTGLSDYYTAGTNAQETSTKTASGTNVIEEQIAARVQGAVQVYEEQVIKEIGYQWHGLNGQFIKLPQVVRTIGNDGRPQFPVITPQDIRYEYDIVPEAGSTQPTNQALLRNQFIQVIQLISSNPVMAHQTDWQAVEKELWQRFGVKEGDKLMTSTPGSQPNQMMGGQALPGAQGQPGQAPQPGQPMPGQQPQLPQGPQTAGTMLGMAAQGQLPAQGPQGPQQMSQPVQPGAPMPNPQGPQGMPLPAGAPPKLPGTISTKFDDLTLDEQKQWLARLGIIADEVTRLQQFAEGRQQDKFDRGMDIAQTHIGMLPNA